MPLYNVLVIDIMETVTLLNILCFSVSSLYNFKIDDVKQTVIAYISTTTTLFMFVGGVIWLMKNNRVEVEEYSLVPLNEPATATEVT